MTVEVGPREALSILERGEGCITPRAPDEAKWARNRGLCGHVKHLQAKALGITRPAGDADPVMRCKLQRSMIDSFYECISFT